MIQFQELLCFILHSFAESDDVCILEFEVTEYVVSYGSKEMPQ